MKDLFLHPENILVVCNKEVGRNSIYCSFYKHWLHKRCSGLKGRLTITSSFKCHGCLRSPENGNEAHKIKLGDVDYGRVNKFCYLGDMLSAGGGAEASSITRVRTGWKKFRELLPLLTSRVILHKMKDNIYKACVRSAMLYSSET